MTTLRNTPISLPHLTSVKNTAAAPCRNHTHLDKIITPLASNNPT
jgi:hypothetical protein